MDKNKFACEIQHILYKIQWNETETCLVIIEINKIRPENERNTNHQNGRCR